jgi:phage terminase large subunit
MPAVKFNKAQINTQVFTILSQRFQKQLNRVDYNTKRYQDDPLSFLKERLACEVWGGAQDVCKSIARSPTSRVVVKAGHGTQKTFLAARLALWFSYNFRPSKVITTAPTTRQVEKLLWSEIHRAYQHLDKRTYPGKMLTLEWRGNSPEWFMLGFASDNPVMAEGFHGENIFIIVDEAKGIDEEIMEGLEGALSGDNARLLLISTAGNPEGYFYDAFGDSLYEHFTFSCQEMVDWYIKNNLTIPKGCTTQRWVDERKQKWGESSVRYKMRVLAQFCESIPEAIIPFEWVQRAMKKKRTKPIQPPNKRRMGVDLAEFGDDNNVFFIGDDYGSIEIDSSNKEEPTDTADRIVDKIKHWEIPAENVQIDSTGLGSGVGSILRKKGYDINCIHFAEGSINPEEYADIVTEMYWNLREKFKNPLFWVEEITELREDLTRRKYKTNNDGAYEIEPKRAFRKVMHRSCDFGDAAALCYLEGRGSGVENLGYRYD